MGCKTWEGEILLPTMPGASPERFAFSVRDDQVARDLMAATGKRVTLTYAQHKGVPGSCFGETEHFLEKVVVGPYKPGSDHFAIRKSGLTPVLRFHRYKLEQDADRGPG